MAKYDWKQLISTSNVGQEENLLYALYTPTKVLIELVL